MPSYGAVQIRWNRVRPSGQPAEDVAVNVVHCQVTDGGWTTDDVNVFESELTTFWNAIKGNISSELTPNERRYYNVPATTGPYGDPAFVRTGTLTAGGATAAAELPPQIAATITWITAIRRRWGRIYIPGWASGASDYARIKSTVVDATGPAAHDFAQNLRGSGQGLVVWHRASWTPQDVTQVRMDDVWDVQRRRRFDHGFHVYTSSILT